MSDHISALLRWLHAHDLPKVLVLACDHTEFGKVPRGAQVVRWNGCLTDASIGLVAQLLALGIDVIQVLSCPQQPGEINRKVREWNSLTPGKVNEIPTLKKTLLRGEETLRLGQIPVPRRVMLGLGLRDKAPYSLAMDDTSRTLAAIELLTARGVISKGEGIEARLGGLRLGATGCTACGICVRACPHDALELRHFIGQSQLWQITENCRAEQQCIALCPEDALWIVGETRLVDLLDDPERKLKSVATSTCEKCGMRHPAEEGQYCKTCSFRQQNPFGTSWIPGKGIPGMPNIPIGQQTNSESES